MLRQELGSVDLKEIQSSSIYWLMRILGIVLKQTDNTSALWSIFKWWFNSSMMSGSYHRMLLVGRDLCTSLGPLLLKTRWALMLNQRAPGHVQLSLQWFQWRFCSCSGPLLQFWTLHWEFFFFSLYVIRIYLATICVHCCFSFHRAPLRRIFTCPN